MKYPPDRFRIAQELTKECFDDHPVWSEYYGFDEREEIASWGINRDWLDAKLQELPEHPHPCYTVLETDPLPDRMRLFIKASFKTPSGRMLAGWVMNKDAVVIGIYVAGKEFVFNTSPLLTRDMQQLAHMLREALGDASDPIFPLQYTTDFASNSSQPVCGVFALADTNS